MNNKEMENYLDQNEIKKLAVDLDNFSYDYDPWSKIMIVPNFGTISWKYVRWKNERRN